MVWTAQQQAQVILRKNWLKSIFFVFICYVVIVLFGNTLVDVRSNDGGFSVSLFSVATSMRLLSVIGPLGALVTSIMHFAILDYYFGLQDRKKRFFSSFLYSFKNPRLLYKGVVITIMNLVLLASTLMIIAFMLLGLLGAGAFLNIGFLLMTAIGVVLLYLYLGLAHVIYILYENPKKG
ncbi:hypothetical protein [Shouchella shacheensis]|uniref:hypothetical protein n=1 Tax=Shouchella shacheensis TaxID=1649580 RepID=UPI00073FB779|nr:hypothetical protein [Shouchella shacheensis]